MATGTMTYNINLHSQDTYTNLDSPTLSAYVTDISNAPPVTATDLVLTSVTIRISNVYLPNHSTISFGALGSTLRSFQEYQNSSHKALTLSSGQDFTITGDEVGFLRVIPRALITIDMYGNNINFQSTLITATLGYSYTPQEVTYIPSDGTIEFYNSATAAWEEVVTPLEIDGASQIRVTLDNAYISEMNHTLTWTCGSYTSTASLAAGVRTATFTIPVSWNNSFPNSENGSGYCRIQTIRSGTTIGYKTVEFPLRVPSSLKPTVGDISTTLYTTNTQVSTLGFYVQNLSGTTVSVSNSSGSYSSTIRSYIIDGVSVTSPERTIASLTSSGVKEIAVVCVDSRGRSSDIKTTSIEIEPYTTPSLSSVAAIRTNSIGEASPKTGTYCDLQANAFFSSVRGNNSVTISVHYKEDVVTATYALAYSSITPMTAYVYGSDDPTAANYFDPTKTYMIRFTATDAFGQSTQKIVPLGTTNYTMFFKRGGNGVGFGMETETLTTLNAIEIADDWEILHGGYTVPRVIYSDTEPTGHEGLIWMPQEAPTELPAALGVDDGGTGATTTVGARRNLQVPGTNQTDDSMSVDYATYTLSGETAERTRVNILHYADADNQEIIHGDDYGVWMHKCENGVWRSIPQQIARGGTGATSRIAALQNLGLAFTLNETETRGNIHAAGYISNSTTEIRFTLYPGKRMDAISTITLTSLQCVIRTTAGGYINGATAENANVQYIGAAGYTVNAYKIHENCFTVRILKDTAFTNVTNNTPVVVTCTYTARFT